MLKNLGSRLQKLFSKSQDNAIPALDAAAVEELQLTFKSRYYSFRQLLTANTANLNFSNKFQKCRLSRNWSNGNSGPEYRK